MANINHEVVVKATSNIVYTALTSHEGIADWWNRVIIAKPHVGFVNIFKVKSTGAIHTELKITDLIPGKRMAYECIKGFEDWVGTKIAFDLEEKDGTTIVRFEQEGWKEITELFDICKTDWLFYLNSLKSFCETGQGTPYEG